MAMRLLIGGSPTSPEYEFERRDIKSRSLQVVTSVDVVGSELAADELYADVDYMAGEYIWFSPKDYDGVKTADGYIFATADQSIDLTQIPFATPVWLMEDTTIRHKLYFDSAERIDSRTYRLTAISGVGLLERRRHKGNLYTSATVADVLADIIGDAFSYSLDANAASQRVSGLLLPDTCRRNLHLLMFAMGISLVKDATGGIDFEFLPNSDETTIPASRIFLGGSITYQTPVTAVEVTEHTFYQLGGTEPVLLFDNTTKPVVDHVLIEFDNAYYDLATTASLTINESGPTYAIISGIGVLTGVPYYHDARVVRLDNPDPTGGQDVIKSDTDYLVNAFNSLSVAKRLLAYYTSPQIVHLPIRVDGEKAGNKVNYADPFGDGEQSGYIISAESVASSFERAIIKIVRDYTPTGQGNNYTHSALITADGTWEVPDGVTEIRIAVIGGGHGGAGGNDGEDGAGGPNFPDTGFFGDIEQTLTEVGSVYIWHGWYPDQPLKKGGAGGSPGGPGKIYVLDASVTPGEVITIAVGAGGAGGAVGQAGSAGTASTASSVSLGTISSDSGVETNTGYVDVFSGRAFGAVGRVGFAGGNGGQTDLFSLQGDSGYAGLPGGDVGSYSGGAGGEGRIPNPEGPAKKRSSASGGGGGGAAYGANGSAGANARWDGAVLHLAAGGAGANAVAPGQAYYGCGGDGGNGGGAGGAAGAGRYYATDDPDEQIDFPDPYRAPGGHGSAGGKGGDGCVIIYY